MYKKAYGIIETLAPLHVGATAGEETGNLNLIFRDQFTQTGIIPGSSIRGRFRADLRDREPGEEQTWYGHEAVDGRSDGGTTEAIVKFEYASLVWFPVFCPGQPVVWVSCPLLLKRFKRIAGVTADIPEPYTAQKGLQGRQMEDRGKILFFNLGFLEIEHEEDLSAWIPTGTDLGANKLVVVHDNDIAMLHDMALYRQSRVKLGSKEKPSEKKV
ncbi:RAMP superfamily CRISPR-associated protein, partial [Kamptonema animale CS-326]|uniref:RAMP superfamily CRISPR-associated protein n=1 Tax=Kamptonema animale TaxID=92934 RepID=UPI002330035A